jgi:hypothetical protein
LQGQKKQKELKRMELNRLSLSTAASMVAAEAAPEFGPEITQLPLVASSQLCLRGRRLAQDVGDAPGAIEIRALADLDFATVGTSQIGRDLTTKTWPPRRDICSTYCTFITAP